MGFSPLKIGNVSVQPNLILAPMSGVTNSSFRRFIKAENPGAIGLVVTEFISIEGMTRENEQSLRMMRFVEAERPISIQIFGHDVARMAAAASMCEQAGADVVDINCGCPVPKVVKKGGGCELMRQPAHLEKILTTVSKALSIPLTIKIRAGWDDSSRNAVEIAKMAEGSGVAMIAVHGRTRQEQYRGNADWDIVQEVANSVQIPVVGSGDVLDAAKTLDALGRGVAGVMIGRGALSYPWVFKDIYDEILGHTPTRRTPVDIISGIERYMSLLCEDIPERGVVGKMKQFISQVTRSIPASATNRRLLCTCSSTQEMRQILSRWKDTLSTDSLQLFDLPDEGRTAHA